MNILMVVKNLRLSNGVSSYVMNYYRKLIKCDDINIDFLVVSDVGSSYYDEIYNNGSKIFFMPKLKNIYKCYKYLEEIFSNNKYDVLHSNVLNSDAIIAIVAKKYDVPVRILHSHATQNGDRFWKKIINWPFFQIAKKCSNVFFACSKKAGDNLFKKSDYHLIYNSIDYEKFKYSEEFRKQIRKENNVEQGTLVLGTIARITKQKNPFFIVDIIEMLKKQNVNFVFWWLGNGDLDDEIKMYANSKNVADKIKFFGATDDIYKYYSALDMFLLPSFYEGLPVVGIEAQINGLLCMFSTNISEEVKLNNNVFFLNINNPSIWYDNILSKECYEHINVRYDDIKKYNIDDSAEDLKKIYIQLCNKYRKEM